MKDVAAGGRASELDRLREECARLTEQNARLRENEQLHLAAAEISRRLVWAADAQGNILTIERPFRPITTSEEEEALKARWTEVIHPDDRPDIVARWTHSLATGEPFRCEFRSQLTDDTMRWTRSQAIAVRDDAGQIIGWHGSAEDIHDERLAEEARREVEERYRLAVKATNDAVWDYDIAHDLIEWSENSAAVMGMDGPLASTDLAWWKKRVHPEDRPRVTRTFQKAFEGNASRWSAAYRFLRGDGRYGDFFDRGFIIRDASGAAIRAVGAMADLTPRKQAEAEIRRMQGELIHVARLSAMGTMASTIAHELNQPLSAVSNYISGARRMVRDIPPMLDEALDLAEASARRAAEIVRRVRELVSRGSVAVQVENLPTIITEANILAFLDEEMRGISHRVELDPAAQWVLADRIQIEQVMINLVRNAVEAMADSQRREIVITTRARDGMAEIEVADTGSGIKPEHMDSLFSQFMTTKSSGLGVGLPISRTIVELHGGTIHAADRPEGGATFCFTLRLAPAPAPDTGDGQGD